MEEALTSVVAEILAYLETATQACVAPPEALRRLQEIKTKHPGINLQLLWDVEPYDGSVHYDVLLRRGDGVTISVSYCRDSELPWPLRGVRRWTDADLVQVNGKILTMQEAVELLDVVWNEAPIMERMINACLVHEELEQWPIEVSDAELQRGMDGWRRAHTLYTADETEQWMQQRGMTHERLERLVTDSLTLIKLRERVADGRVERYFENHRDQFTSPNLDETTRVAIEELLLGEWLAERRRTAKIQWHWGTAHHR